jgi:rhamnulokinase
MPLMAGALLLPPLRSPGDVIGPVQPGVSKNAGQLDGLPLIAVDSHDTASAVAAVPASGRHFVYISSGTWSLVGMELDAPVLTEASRRAGFTNEAGLDGRIRYLHNVTGLWLLQESLRGWRTAGRAVELGDLLAEAAGLAPLTSVVDTDDPVFLPPGDMPGRLAAACARDGIPSPSARPRWPAASWTAWPWPTGGRSSRPSSCPGGPPTSSTWSAAGCGTTCCAS